MGLCVCTWWQYFGLLPYYFPQATFNKMIAQQNSLIMSVLGWTEK